MVTVVLSGTRSAVVGKRSIAMTHARSTFSGVLKAPIWTTKRLGRAPSATRTSSWRSVRPAMRGAFLAGSKAGTEAWITGAEARTDSGSGSTSACTASAKRVSGVATGTGADTMVFSGVGGAAKATSTGAGSIVGAGAGLSTTASAKRVSRTSGARASRTGWPGSATGVTPSSAATRVEPASGWAGRSDEHTSELQSLMRISYVVFCLEQKK